MPILEPIAESATHDAGLVVGRVAGGGHRGCFGGLTEVTQEARDAAGLGGMLGVGRLLGGGCCTGLLELKTGAVGGTAGLVANQRAGRPAKAGGSKKSPAGKSRSHTMSKAERRQRILMAARDVFAKRGYHQATVDDIVAEAGVARGTFYLYFEDKRAVLADLIDRFSARITLAIMHIDPGDASRTIAEQARANIHAIVGVCLAERAMTKILFTDATGIDPDFDRKLYTFYDAVVQQITESLKEGQALGIVADGEPRVLAYLSIGALKELLYQAVTLGLAEESADALTQQLYVFLCEGYLRVSPDRRVDRSRRRR